MVGPVGSGRFALPPSATSFLTLPLIGPVPPSALETMTLPVLIARVVARPQVSGIMTLAHGARSIPFPVVGGRPHMNPREREAVTQAFGWSDGSYSFEPKGTSR